MHGPGSPRADPVARRLMGDVADPLALLELAERAARDAGELLIERFAAPGEGVRAKSTPTDLVSDADLSAERAIRAVLAQRGDDAILGEEGGGEAPGPSGLRWVVDPLDGTVNFLFGIPHWCVSVACEDDVGAVVGVVFDPLRDELFRAVREGGARRGEERLAGPERRELSQAMVATGFAYDAGVRDAQAQVAARVLPRVRDLRRLGSAALDLAWTAVGRFDAYYERAVQPWDVAAGELLCAEAGLGRRALVGGGESEPPGILIARAELLEELGELVA